MNKLLILLAITLANLECAQAQITLSDFSALATQSYTPFNVTWGSNYGTDQYIQNAGNVTIYTVGAVAGPNGQGSFDAVFQGHHKPVDGDLGSTPVDFSAVATLSLTAKLGASDVDQVFTVIVQDSGGATVGQASFSGFTTASFSTITVPFTFTQNAGFAADATFFTFAGDATPNQVQAIFDNLQANFVGVPEPSALPLLLSSAVGIGIYRLRKIRSASVI